MVDPSVFKTLGKAADNAVSTIDETVSNLLDVLAGLEVQQGALCLAIALHLAAETSARNSDPSDPDLPKMLVDNSNVRGAEYAAILMNQGFMQNRVRVKR